MKKEQFKNINNKKKEKDKLKRREYGPLGVDKCITLFNI